jgi:hypothetical protein
MVFRKQENQPYVYIYGLCTLMYSFSYINFLILQHPLSHPSRPTYSILWRNVAIFCGQQDYDLVPKAIHIYVQHDRCPWTQRDRTIGKQTIVQISDVKLAPSKESCGVPPKKFQIFGNQVMDLPYLKYCSDNCELGAKCGLTWENSLAKLDKSAITIQHYRSCNN